MPGNNKPVGAAVGMWQWVQQILAAFNKRLTNLENAQTQILVDQYGNAVAIIGQLAQTVTEGASYGNAGSQASTGLTGVGIATHKSGSWVQIG